MSETGFRVDTGAVSAVGGRLRALGQHADAGSPPGTSGCGAAAVADGRPVSAITTFRGSDTSIAAWHVYYVTGIEDARIVVQNPWGREDGSGVEETLRLTEEEFDATFSWASIGVDR